MSSVTSAKEKYASSHLGSAELIRPVMGVGAFSNANHLRVLGEESRDGQKDRDEANKTKLTVLFDTSKVTTGVQSYRPKTQVPD